MRGEATMVDGVDIFRAEDGAIEFWQNGRDWMFYDLSAENQKKGLDYWIRQLSGKEWFGAEEERVLRSIWR